MDHPVMSGWDSHANWYTWTQDFEPYWHQNSSVYPYPRPSSQYGGSCQEKRAATETESEPSCNEGTDLDKAERDKNEIHQYRVKIISPLKKSDFIVRELHHFHGKFDSVTSLKLKLMDEFGELVPATTDFQIGYFRGKQSTKYWIMCQEDLDMMNDSLGKGKPNILLWCDGRSADSLDSSDSASSCGRKRKSPPVSEPLPSKRQQLDDSIADTVKELKEKHESKYTFPQLRLWARMIVAGNHDSTDTPPLIPAITGIQPKREKKSSLSDVIAGAAVTFANAVKSPDIQQRSKQSIVISSDAMSSPVKPNSSLSVTPTTGISPAKVTELRMKKLRELRELQELLEQNILTQQEFMEQKKLVLDSLRKLTH